MALSQGVLYWTDRGADPATDACGDPNGTLVGMSLAEQVPVVLAQGLECPMDVTVDGSGVYWAEYGTDTSVTSGAVKELPKL